jgi:hypothetical protein
LQGCHSALGSAFAAMRSSQERFAQLSVRPEVLMICILEQNDAQPKLPFGPLWRSVEGRIAAPDPVGSHSTDHIGCVRLLYPYAEQNAPEGTTSVGWPCWAHRFARTREVTARRPGGRAASSGSAGRFANALGIACRKAAIVGERIALPYTGPWRAPSACARSAT